MMLRFACPRCQFLLEAPDAIGGTKLGCPGCGQRLQVPMPPPSRTVLAPLVAHTPTALQPGHQPLPAAVIPPGAIRTTPAAPPPAFPWKRVLAFAEVAGLLILLLVFVSFIIRGMAPSQPSPPDIMATGLWAAVWGLGIFLYFLPSFIAVTRGHQNCLAIFVVNALLGCVLLGWVAALVWALTTVDRTPHA